MRVQASTYRKGTERSKKYAYFTCIRSLSGCCTNRRTVPENRLRSAVIAQLRQRLFPQDGSDGVPAWFPDLVAQVEIELRQRLSQEPVRTAATTAELEALGGKIQGWLLSLGNPQLDPDLRREIEVAFAQARQRRDELRRQAETRLAQERHVSQLLDPAAVLRELHRLDSVLAGSNPTLINLELSRHIDAVTCFVDGRFELRGTKLGLFDGAVELLRRHDSIEAATAMPQQPNEFAPVNPRQRGAVRLPTLAAADVIDESRDTVLDPERFVGLPDGFLWTDELMANHDLCWSETNAAAVAARRRDGLSHERLADAFGVSIPTIRAALRRAAKVDPSLALLPRKVRPVRKAAGQTDD